MPSAAVACAATIMSSNDSPGMNFDTARRTNGNLVPLARSHWLSEIFRSTVRATLTLLSYASEATLLGKLRLRLASGCIILPRLRRGGLEGVTIRLQDDDGDGPRSVGVGVSVCRGPTRNNSGHNARTAATTSSVANPPPTTDNVGPKRAAVAPLSNAPNSFRSEEHTSELQSQSNLVCRLLLEKKKKKKNS